MENAHWRFSIVEQHASATQPPGLSISTILAESAMEQWTSLLAFFVNSLCHPTKSQPLRAMVKDRTGVDVLDLSVVTVLQDPLNSNLNAMVRIITLADGRHHDEGSPTRISIARPSPIRVPVADLCQKTTQMPAESFLHYPHYTDSHSSKQVRVASSFNTLLSVLKSEAPIPRAMQCDSRLLPFSRAIHYWRMPQPARSRENMVKAGTTLILSYFTA
ncbi:hypothetical protein BU15DRAFT_67205 [Melanogaster broomeanus]|nr:hypothetical protein BU15DRAFT_67205 [Melanogaster broomeanus]